MKLTEKQINNMVEALFDVLPTKFQSYLSEYDGEEWQNSLVDHTLDDPDFKGTHYVVDFDEEELETVSVGIDEQKQEICLITEGCWSVITVFDFSGKIDELRAIEV